MESIRQKLAKRKDFDVGKAFITMAAEQRAASNSFNVKFLTVHDLARLMRKHDHLDNLKQQDLPLLMSRFDKDGDNRISINEVSN